LARLHAITGGFVYEERVALPEETMLLSCCEPAFKFGIRIRRARLDPRMQERVP
jgi:hypothetical protein